MTLWSEFPLGGILEHWRHSSLLRCGKTTKIFVTTKLPVTVYFNFSLIKDCADALIKKTFTSIGQLQII